MISLSATAYATGVVWIGRQAAMKHQRKPRKELKVTVFFSELSNPCARRHHGELPSADVAAIRKKAGLSQSAFANSIGVPAGTVRNWEQGRRQPSGPAKVLLALLTRRPNLVAEIYPQPQPRSRWAPGPPDPNTMTAEERQAEVGQIIAVAMNRVSNRQNSRSLDSFGFRKPDGKN
jgi:putative transcriptional regulator